MASPGRSRGARGQDGDQGRVIDNKGVIRMVPNESIGVIIISASTAL